MPPYFLWTPRVVFRTWTEDDLELALALWSDPVVTEWLGGPFTDAAVRERLAREIATQENHGVQYWPIFRRLDIALAGKHQGGPLAGRCQETTLSGKLLDSPLAHQHLGCCGLRPYRVEEGVYELGFHLRPEHWGQGYASEAARAAIGYAFDSLGARALFAGHHPRNTASSRLLAKLGFRYTHDEFYPPTGLEHPSYLLESPLPL